MTDGLDMSEPSASTLRTLALMRLEDARLLHANGRYPAAYYLAGYAVECGLKTVVAQTFIAGVIPDRSFVQNVYTHDLAKLVKLANLSGSFQRWAEATPGFATSWAIASRWNEASRYDMMMDAFGSELMLGAVGNDRSGVIAWLREHW